MGQRTQALGTTTYGPAYSTFGAGTVYASKFRASDHYTSPVTGAIGVSSRPILVTALSITSFTGTATLSFAADDASPNGFGNPEATNADTLCYYGFTKTNTSEVSFRRGAGANPNGIFLNGSSTNPETTSPVKWPDTSIAASITWQHIPDAPTSFISTARTNSSITLSWVAPTDNGGAAVENYRVLYKVRNTSTDTSASSWAVKVIGSTATSTTVTGLLANTTYDFRVAATNNVTDVHSGGAYTSASAIVGANATLNSITTDNVVINESLTIMPEGILTLPYIGRISSSGVVTYGLTSGSLPTGLTLSTSTGFVTGTPTAVGTYNFTITVYSGGVAATSRAFTVIIYNSSPKVVTGSGPTTSRGVLKVYSSGWQPAYMRVYDSTYTGSDGTHWRPIS
jgi:hypothetical protein